MGTSKKEEKKSYVSRYLKKLEDAKEFEEETVVTLSLRLDSYVAEILGHLVKKYGTKKSTFLREPVEDLILRAAKEGGIVDENNILTDEYQEAS